MKKQSAFRIAFPVSAVWFGAIVGPSMISGVYESVYFAPYGAWGIILPMIAMGIAAVVIGMGANVARRFRVYDYNSYSKKLYGKFSKILTPVLEIYMVIAMIVGGAIVVGAAVYFGSLDTSWTGAAAMTVNTYTVAPMDSQLAVDASSFHLIA